MSSLLWIIIISISSVFCTLNHNHPFVDVINSGNLYLEEMTEMILFRQTIDVKLEKLLANLNDNIKPLELDIKNLIENFYHEILGSSDRSLEDIEKFNEAFVEFKNELNNQFNRVKEINKKFMETHTEYLSAVLDNPKRWPIVKKAEIRYVQEQKSEKINLKINDYIEFMKSDKDLTMEALLQGIDEYYTLVDQIEENEKVVRLQFKEVGKISDNYDEFMDEIVKVGSTLKRHKKLIRELEQIQIKPDVNRVRQLKILHLIQKYIMLEKRQEDWTDEENEGFKNPYNKKDEF